MELLGEEVGQLWGRRPPYIVGGTIQPLPPKQPRRSDTTAGGSGTTAGHNGTTASLGGTTAEFGGQERYGPERFCRGGRAVLPLMSGTAALLPLQSTAQSDMKNDPSSRCGRGLVPQRYYC